MNRILCAFILLPNLVSAALLTDKVTLNFLPWSKDLEAILNPITVEKVREMKKSGADWRYFATDNYETVKTDLEPKLKAFSGKAAADQKAHPDGFTAGSKQELEFVQPLQKFVACKPKDNISGTIKVLCLTGPKGEFDLVSKDRPTGEPGTKCDSGYENDDGLCVVAKPKKATENPRKPSETAENPSEAATVENQGIQVSISTFIAIFSTIWLIFY